MAVGSGLCVDTLWVRGRHISEVTSAGCISVACRQDLTADAFEQMVNGSLIKEAKCLRVVQEAPRAGESAVSDEGAALAGEGRRP